MNQKISIITAVYNGEKLLPRLIKSINQQTYSNKEFIVIDGASTDGTIEIIKDNEKEFAYWISEPDHGIYDAWNKGLEKASGDWIMFLGCDDILLPNALLAYIKFIESLKDQDKLDIIHSKIEMISKEDKPIRVKGWKYKYPIFLKEMTIAHPGALHSKKFFAKYGKFDTTYKIVGDYELLLRPGRNLKTAFMNEITVYMSEGGVSDSVNAIKEHYKAVTTTGSYPKYKALINTLIVYIKFVIKKQARRVGLNLYLKHA